MNTQPKQTELFAGVEAIAKDIAFEFRYQRKRLDWTQKEAAERINCDATSVSHLESYERFAGTKRGFPSMDLIRRACSAYGISEFRMLERCRNLRAMTGKPGDMRNYCGVGTRKPRSSEPLYVRYPGSIHQPREVNQFPDLAEEHPELFKPGLDRDALIAICIWGVVSGLALWSIYFWGYAFYQGRVTPL
jgi:transcriptional regulator with XRE-family HTH domain